VNTVQSVNVEVNIDLRRAENDILVAVNLLRYTLIGRRERLCKRIDEGIQSTRHGHRGDIEEWFGDKVYGFHWLSFQSPL
jgi:hypothetical protein